MNVFSFECSFVVFPLRIVDPVRTFDCSAVPPSACVGHGVQPSRTAVAGDAGLLPPCASTQVSGTPQPVHCCLVACAGLAIEDFGGRSSEKGV